MREKARREERNEGRGEGATGEPTHKELEPLLWQAHVNEEMESLAREHQPAPEVHHFAEEYAENAMRGVEASGNEYQHAAERGEPRGVGGVAGELADAGDIAGG